MLRNIGGSLGVAVATTMLARRSQYHQVALVGRLDRLESRDGRAAAGLDGALRRARGRHLHRRPARDGHGVPRGGHAGAYPRLCRRLLADALGVCRRAVPHPVHAPGALGSRERGTASRRAGNRRRAITPLPRPPTEAAAGSCYAWRHDRRARDHAIRRQPARAPARGVAAPVRPPRGRGRGRLLARGDPVRGAPRRATWSGRPGSSGCSSTWRASIALVDHPLYAKSAVPLTTTSGVHAATIAEYAVTALLALCHRVPRMVEWKGRGGWPPDAERWPLFVPTEIRGATLGIIGYGSIGRELARIAKTAFGMRVLALQARPVAPDRRGLLPRRHGRSRREPARRVAAPGGADGPPRAIGRRGDGARRSRRRPRAMLGAAEFARMKRVGVLHQCRARGDGGRGRARPGARATGASPAPPSTSSPRSRRRRATRSTRSTTSSCRPTCPGSCRATTSGARSCSRRTCGAIWTARPLLNLVDRAKGY